MAELAQHAMANVTPTGRVNATLLRDQSHRLVFMPEYVPDRVDRAVVAKLQRDGRIANVDLADAISLSP
jgi:Lrp/AsnC family leucine-responsive transcriptional regulator